LEQQPPDGDSETPNGAGRGERDDLSDLNFTSGDEERAIRNDRGDQESRRPPRGEAPRERSAGRREPVDRDSPRAERPSRPEAASGRTSSPPSAPTGGFDWDAPLERAPIDRAEASRGADDDAWGGSGSESRPRSGGSSAGEGEARGDGSDDQSGRRRRRRGRRGGRRRGGRERVGDEQAAGPRETSPGAGSPGDTHEDEPLPAGYGRAPQAPRPGVEGGKSDEAGRAGDGESRGRRRRGRGERRDEGGRPARSGGEVGTDAGESRGRGRSSRRRGRSGGRSEPELRPTSSLSRGRREDFAPVAGGYEEDDEGLDFLGIEDTGREGSPQRESRRGDDDEILVESVSDVPSWVEAIGIVIAGNLDARNRPPRGDDHDRGRRDQQRGGRS